MATHQTPNPYAAAAAPKPRPRRRNRWLIAAWSLLGLLALVVALLGAAWWWAGGDTSLAAALNRAARYLPAGQTLESREVTGSLRGGGRIGWLRWTSPGMTVEVNEARIGWRLAPLVLQRKVQLGEVHAARVLITPQPTDQPKEPTQPLQRLALPMQVDLPFRVDELVWAPPAADPLTIRALAGRYGYDGARHALVVDNVELAQGRYAANATLGAEAPMPLDLTLAGTVRTPSPGGGAELEATAHATVKGTLATEAARLQVAAQLRSTVAGAEAASPAASAPAATPPRRARNDSANGSAKAAKNKATNKAAASQQATVALPPEPMESTSLYALNISLSSSPSDSTMY